MKKALFFLTILLPFGNMAADNNSDYQQWLAARQQRYQHFQQQYLERYKQFQKQVVAKWHERSELSGKREYVLYNQQLSLKTVLDFANNEIRVEALDGESLPDAEQLLKTLSGTSLNQALSQDPVLALQHLPMTGETLLNAIAGHLDTEQLAANQSAKQVTTQAGDKVSTLTISLPTTALQERARPYLPQVNKLAVKYQLDPSLILAVINTESAFNPLAQSPIPAFGLMQIVPTSAGLDVNQKIFRRNRQPTAEELFDANTNLAFGSGYLHLLDNQYLAGITDSESRRYCMIAAYNTGAGNVASVFSADGSRNLSSAVAAINRQTPEQVYQALSLGLPYQETRDYLHRVTTTQKEFSSLL